MSNSGIEHRTGTVRLEPIPTKQNENIASRPAIDIAGCDLIVNYPKKGTRERRASEMEGGYLRVGGTIREGLLTEDINKVLINFCGRERRII